MLGIVPLAVCGVTVAGEAIALGERSSGVTQYPGCFELVPSGGFDASRIRPDGSVDVRAQILVELEEEAGVPAEAVIRAAPLALIHDQHDETLDLCWALVLAPAWAERVASLPKTQEYASLRWLERPALRAFLDAPGRKVVPVSRAILDLVERDRAILVAPGDRT